ncbi:MAG: SET domain-containing protein [Candidatus Melainabacteria bacterium]|jgi:hypothetical protein
MACITSVNATQANSLLRLCDDDSRKRKKSSSQSTHFVSDARIHQALKLHLGPGGLICHGSSFSSPYIQARRKSDDGQLGVFATRSFSPGEIITIFAGDVVNRQELESLPKELQTNSLQVGDNYYLIASKNAADQTAHNDPAEHYNHSCNPNAFITGNNILFARKLIKAGEEIRFDYGTTDSGNNPDGNWVCTCGAANCRKNSRAEPQDLLKQYGAKGVPNYTLFKALNPQST